MGKWQDKLVKIDDYRWLIPCSYKPGMLVPGLIYATESMLENIIDEQTYEQVANVATLPGILRYSYGMPA